MSLSDESDVSASITDESYEGSDELQESNARNAIAKILLADAGFCKATGLSDKASLDDVITRLGECHLIDLKAIESILLNPSQAKVIMTWLTELYDQYMKFYHPEKKYSLKLAHLLQKLIEKDIPVFSSLLKCIIKELPQQLFPCVKDLKKSSTTDGPPLNVFGSLYSHLQIYEMLNSSCSREP
ncbi:MULTISPECIES: hypothetical protein [Cysteiniphilum]|uniref:hypothetical protein n=1 Tax=Cysteiniphilum TaxID=2056696 RepID=UPI00177CBE2E|nr:MULTISPECIES: hypothetical protein [Cysteiniphilum]